MIALVGWLGIGLFFWSVRWAILITLLAVWFWLRPPRLAATRHLLCAAMLLAGLALPLAPGWTVPLPRPPAPGHVPAATPPAGPRAELAPEIDGTRPMPGPPPVQIEPARSAPVQPEFLVIRPEPIRWRRLALLALALIWLAGSVVAMCRLAAGWWILARLRRAAESLVGSTANQFELARRAVGSGRRVTGASHPAIASPVAVGGWSPLVLVPTTWESWTDSDQRACLLHELAHLARGDDRWKLVAELARVPFWFHPGVIWLVARLDREAELAADEATVAHGVNPRDLAQLLLRCAQIPHRLDPAALLARPQALAFFARPTALIRINRLLEDDMPCRSIRPSRLRQMILGAAVATVALAVGGARSGAIDSIPPAPAPSVAFPQTLTPPADPAVPPPARSFTVAVQDEDGKPVAAAWVVMGKGGRDRSQDVAITQTGADGVARFEREVRERTLLVAYKEGFSFTTRTLIESVSRNAAPLVLPRAQSLLGTVADSAGQPVAGAEIRVERARSAAGQQIFMNPAIERLAEGTPVEAALRARSDAAGRFRFDAVPAASMVGLVASAPGKATINASGRTKAGDDAGPGASSEVRIILGPEARVVGRVVSRVPDVAVAGRVVQLLGIRGGPGWVNSAQATTDAAGRFELAGLKEGPAVVLLDESAPDGPWTSIAANGVILVPGQTADATIEIIPGVQITGNVAGTDGMPLANVMLEVASASNPQAVGRSMNVLTDLAGNYRFRVPPGDLAVHVSSSPVGYTIPGEGAFRQTVVVPADVATFPLRPFLMAPRTQLAGRIVDGVGAVCSGARVTGSISQTYSMSNRQEATTTDADGRFRLETLINGQPIPLGEAVSLDVRLEDGQEFDAVVVPRAGKDLVDIKLPTLRLKKPTGPAEVASDEIAGVVVDTQGRPLGGVLVHPISWVPRYQTTTDRDGQFRIKVPNQRKIEVRLTKDGFEPREFLRQPIGQPGWVVVMDNRTYFEGRVVGPDGSPVADAPIRADSGPKRLDGARMNSSITEARSGADGRYRLYVEPGLYEFQVRVPGSGVLRLARQAIGTDEVVPLDLKLAAGVAFEAHIVDSVTGQPVAGFKLENWHEPGVTGTSDAAGVVRIAAMLPGRFQFFKLRDETRFARWWSSACVTEYSRFQLSGDRMGFQRNFDALDFELTPGMKPVTIQVEPSTTIRGVVLDPEGRPVPLATVAPALTGSGNSLTGDTRFSVTTDAQGAYTLELPASGAIAYNLVAHDANLREPARTWANGVTDPFSTRPGQVIENQTISLTRPATVTGRVIDAATGQPIANREVRASAADKRENRYYDPTTRTGADGTFTLPRIRPGMQLIQVAPFWLNATDAPGGSSQTIGLTANETHPDVVLRATEEPR